jgi:hypothetical protein
LALSVAAGQEAAKRGVKAFVELSTGMVYKPDSQPSKEGDKLKPWSKIAVFKLQAEEQLAKIEGCVLFVARRCCFNVPIAPGFGRTMLDHAFRPNHETQADLPPGST